MAQPEESDTRDLVVGFADMVEFTRTTRELSPSELTDLIDQFQAVTAEVVTRQHGRVVKHIGDEVLYTAEEPAAGAEIAVELMERLADIDTAPELRIGMAVGPVVTRFGDVYGEVVNVAARLTDHGPPGRILVDRHLAAALGTLAEVLHLDRVAPRRPAARPTAQGTNRYRVKRRRRLRVHGYTGTNASSPGA
jgi:adenylate cyclase